MLVLDSLLGDRGLLMRASEEPNGVFTGRAGGPGSEYSGSC